MPIREPACYRNGGPLAVTDANVMLRRGRAERFLSVFGPDGDQPLDRAAVSKRFAALAEEVRSRNRSATPPRRTSQPAA